MSNILGRGGGNFGCFGVGAQADLCMEAKAALSCLEVKCALNSCAQ